MTEDKKERYSFSKLSSFHTCPYGYKITYIDHDKGIGNCFSSYGSLVHSILERYAKGQLSLDSLPTVYSWEFEPGVPEPFPKSKYCDMRDTYFKQGLSFFQEFRGYKNIDILEVEGSFELPIDDWTFNGVIDLVYRDADGKLILQDYKSKAKFTSKAEQQKYARQLYLYSLFIKEKYGQYPDIMRFLMFRKQNIVDIKFDIDACTEALDWAKQTVKEIRQCWDYTPRCDDFFGHNLCNHRNTCTYVCE